MMKKIKKEFKKLHKKTITLTLVFAVLFSFFAPITKVIAASNTTKLSVSFRGDNANYGKVQYSLNDGANWQDITENISNLNISVSGDNLRLKIVPNENYSVDYAGIEMRHGEDIVGGLSTIGLESDNGYAVPSNVQSVQLSQVEFRYEPQNNQQGEQGAPELNTSSNVNIHIEGEELEYDQPWSDDAADFIFGINNSPEMRRLSKNEVNYIRENDNIVGLDTKNAINYQYDYNDEGTVTFHIRTQWDDVITSLKINDVLYNTPQTKETLIDAFRDRGIAFDIPNVPYAETYNIEVVGRKQTEQEKIMGNFGWTYDPNTNEFSDDDKIPNGNLEFVKAVYNGVTYNSKEEVNAVGGVFEWHNGVKGSNDPYGEAMFPVGTELTIRLIPDAGYQLTSFDLNGTPFEPGDEVGLYTFTIGGGNWHLGAHFTEVSDEVQTNSKNIKSGNIDINTSRTEGFENGTAKLEVNDIADMTTSRIEKFKTTATEEGYEIENYLDISLYNSIYKGGKKDSNGNYESWDTPVESIDEKATITLALEDDMNGKDLVIVHEKHNGNEIIGYELIDAIYNEENNTITFKTDSFSNYAIASKQSTDNKNKLYTVEDNNGNIISFKEEENHEYQLNMIDYLTLTDEDLEEIGVLKENYNNALEQIKTATKKYGNLLAFYEIEVLNEDNYQIHEGPFNIKIKMTDEMKKYNTFNLIYVEDDLSIGTPITLTVDGDYLTGTLDHLSTYALVGDNTSNDKTNNPKTGDNIMLYVAISGLSLICLAGRFIYINKLKKNNY